MADNFRPSERTARESERHGSNAVGHLGNAMDEVHAAFRETLRGFAARGESIVQGTTERTHDVLEAGRRLGRQAENWRDERARDAQRVVEEAGRTADRLGRQASHIPGDTVVRARRELRRAGEGVTEGLDARERQLYPEEYRSRDRVVRQPQTENRTARPAQHTETTAAAQRAGQTSEHTQNANHDYVVRRGDSIWSIVRANEERLHPGVHNRRQEALIVQRLVSRHGETILPGMHLDLG